MKRAFLVILTLFALYNPKVEAALDGREILLIENASSDADQVTILTKSPLKDIRENTRNYVILMRLFQDLGESNREFFNRLLNKIQNHNTLSGDDLYLIKRAFQTFIKINSKMLEFEEVYRARTSPLSKVFSKPESRKPVALAQLIWLSSNVVVMEQLESLHQILYLADGSFRRIFKTSIDVKELSEADKKNIKLLGKMVKDVSDTLESKKFLQQLILYRSISKDLREMLKKDESAQVIIDEILNNKIATQVVQGRKSFKLEVFAKGDAVIGFFNQVTNLLSSVFGNIAGAIHWREGYLFQDERAATTVKNELRPMDIILEKSPFILTDKFIPGHYGHAALYLGTRSQLEEIGMWDHPEIIPYQDDIEAGKTILEAVRPGVRLNSVEGFMNIDEFTILRKEDGLTSPLQVAEQISRGMNQIGKEYDFNFDISTLDKIVCSELLYIVYGHVSWPTRYRLGRPTITPDDLAEIVFQKDTRFHMSDYLLSTKRHISEKADLSTLAYNLDYELRGPDGDVIKDSSNPGNSFWKKETKCYNVTDVPPHSDGDYSAKRECKTTYKQYQYEETSGF